MNPDIADVLAGRRRWCVVTGDCLEILPTLPDDCVDAVVTDPPYGIGWEYATYDDTFAAWVSLIDGFVPHAKRVAKCVTVSTGSIESDKHMMNVHNPSWRLCWYRGSTSSRSPIGFRDWEMVWVFGKPPTQMHDYFACSPETKDMGHSCPKPVGYGVWIIKRTSSNSGVILDPFAGSGTTGVAAIKTGRRFIGVELNPAYADIARRRIAEADTHLFNGVGA